MYKRILLVLGLALSFLAISQFIADRATAQCVPGDVDGSGAIDLDDVIYIFQYMFYQGPAPPPCPGIHIDVDSIYVQDHWTTNRYSYRLWGDTLQEIWWHIHVLDSFYVLSDTTDLLHFNRTILERTYDTTSIGIVEMFGAGDTW